MAKILKDEIVKTTSLSDIKCPVCGGPVNTYEVLTQMFDSVILLCECWSGNLHAKSKYHLFRVITGPLAKVDLRPEEEV